MRPFSLPEISGPSGWYTLTTLPQWRLVNMAAGDKITLSEIELFADSACAVPIDLSADIIVQARELVGEMD